MEKKHLPIEETQLFLRLKALSNLVWTAVLAWDTFARQSLGNQLVKAMDSVGANLVEGDGRYSEKEAIHFFHIARGSLRETEYWLALAKDRGLIAGSLSENFKSEIDECRKMLNGLIAYRRANLANIVKEEIAPYDFESASSGLTPQASGPNDLAPDSFLMHVD